jgi:hypothetical protein
VTEHIGDVTFDRPEDERHATIHAAAGWEGDDPVDLTREQARALILVLAEYATSPDPGPGAPYPLPKPLTPEESDALWRSWMDQVSGAFAEKLDAGLADAGRFGSTDLGNGTLVPRITRGIETTPVPGSLGRVCPWCAGNGRVLGGSCPQCSGVGYR